MKRCSKCGASKSCDAFYGKARSADGKASWCKACHKEAVNGRAQAPARKAAARARHLARYSMSPEQYAITLAEQGGGCAVCGRACPTGRSLAVDHDHQTGKVRGLLCMLCNRGLGMFNDDPERLEQGIDYLRKAA